MPGQPLRSPLRRCLFVALIALGPLALPATAHAQIGEKRVLVLYSTRRDAEFSIVGQRELPTILDVGLARNLDYYSEFVDLSRSPESNYLTAFRDFLRQKYQGVRFDLVIAMQDAAVDFINDFGDALFPGTPVVFLKNGPVTERHPNSTGVIHERNFAGTVALIRQLQPDVQQIFVIAGAADGDKEFEEEARRQLQPLSGSGVTFNYLSGLANADLEARLSHLPERSAAYYVIVTGDAHGARPHPLNYLDRLSAVANAPTYSWVNSTINHGVVGGSLYSQTAAIERVGSLALRVLGGEPADSIAPIHVDLNSNEVDWRQLQRWRIDDARLPTGTVVMFREPSLWNQYRRYILAAVTLFAMQTALIAGLLLQRTRRRRAEVRLHESQTALLGSHEHNRDLAARLLRAQETERSRIACELHDDICQRMLLLTIELEAAASASHRGGAAPSAALTLAHDIAASLRDLSHGLHPARLRVLGLVSALDGLCTELSRAGTPIAFSHDSVPPGLPPDVMLCLFRVAQEALQNALKYSRATEIAVHLDGTSGSLILTILDNGVGFDVDEAWGTGVGIGSMFERLQAAGGSLEVISGPETGTRLVAILPPLALQSGRTQLYVPEVQGLPA